ncbi:hypothetical protein V5O48_016304 [Marasmius crinis-equi]|uniref:Uncharacterized protein n=1 Tax=Marasmius crinis-equi TaxID=585013 RepID=A0ABR3ES88_9AGAR
MPDPPAPMEQDPPDPNTERGMMLAFVNALRATYQGFANINVQPQQNGQPDNVGIFGPVIWFFVMLLQSAGIRVPVPGAAQPAPAIARARPRPRGNVRHRDPRQVSDSRIIRKRLKEVWQRTGPRQEFGTPSEAIVKQFAERVKLRNLTRRSTNWQLPSVFSERETNPIVFTDGSTEDQRIWNRGMGAWVLKHHLLQSLNAIRPESDKLTFDAVQDRDKIVDLIEKVFDQVDYVTTREYQKSSGEWEQRKIRSKEHQSRERIFKRRLEIILAHEHLRQTEDGFRLLGTEGMSSDEEDNPNNRTSRLVHEHPWRSAEAENLINRTRHIQAIEDRAKPRGRGNAPNHRRVEPNNPRRLNSVRGSKAFMDVPEALPENFYNIAKLERRAQYQNLNVKSLLRMQPAAPNALRFNP